MRPTVFERMDPIHVSVNGKAHFLDEWSGTMLLGVLQIKLGYLEGVIPCGLDQCGECTVLVDGPPMRACKTPLAQVAGKTILLAETLG